MSHFGCIGLALRDQTEMMELVDRMIDAAVEDAPATPPARHLRWTDGSGAAVAIHFDDAQSIACVTPYFAAAAPAVWKVRTTASADDAECAHCGGADCDVLDGSGELVTRTAVQWLHYQPYRAWLGETREFGLQVVAFGHRVACYASREAFEEGQTSWGWGTTPGPTGQPLRLAAESFLPEGLFQESREMGDRALALFTGKVTAAARPTNGLVGGEFVHLRVQTLPGEVDVVAEAVEGEPAVGAHVIVHAWLVGRPEPPPPPAPEAKRRGWLRALRGGK